MENNVLRLKEKIGFKEENHDVDSCFELIDRIYYKNDVYVEEENGDGITWFFSDGTRISLEQHEIVHLALFLMSLYYDADEQLVEHKI